MFFTSLRGPVPWGNHWLLWTGVHYATAALTEGAVRVTRRLPTQNVAWYSITIPLTLWVTMTLAERRDYLVSFLRSKDEMREAADSLPVSQDPAWEAKYPAIYEYIVRLKMPDGSKRTTSTLTVSLYDGAFRACLNDRHNGYSLFVTCDTVEGSIEALEAALKAARPAWRKNDWQPNGPARKGSK